MTKHTPGPWHLGEKHATEIDGFPVNAFPISAHGQAIARVWAGRDLTMGNEHANARLIAAAPDLLEALKDLRDELASLKWGQPFPGRPHAMLDEADAAIAKATGEA